MLFFSIDLELVVLLRWFDFRCNFNNFIVFFVRFFIKILEDDKVRDIN